LKQEPVFFRGKMRGHIDYGEEAYITYRGEEHLFYKYDGFGISEGVLDILHAEGIEKIILFYKGYKIETNINQFIVHGHEWVDKTFGKAEKQLILPLKFCKKTETHEAQGVLGAWT